MRPDGGSAFPSLDHSEGIGLVQREPGMSRRDYFAAAALSGAGHPIGLYLSASCGSKQCEDVAKRAYEIADAMIAESTRDI